VFVPQMQGVQQSKDTTLASNRNLAELNLDLQPKLEQRKEHLSKHYSSLQESFEAYQFRKSTLGMLTCDEHDCSCLNTNYNVFIMANLSLIGLCLLTLTLHKKIILFSDLSFLYVQKMHH